MSTPQPSPSSRSTARSPFPCALVGSVGSGIQWSPAARTLGLGLEGGLSALEALVRSLVPLELEPDEPVSSVPSQVTRCLTSSSGETVLLRAELASDALGEFLVRFIDDTVHTQAARKADEAVSHDQQSLGVEDLHALLQSAEQASALKSRFLANMSHEIRTPLYGVLGMLEAGRLDATQEGRDSALTSAESCARTLLAVINDILDLSRVEEGKLSIAFEPFDLCTMLHGAVGTLGGYGLKRGVEVRLTGDVSASSLAGPGDGAEDAPPDRVPLIGDPGRMSQVLVNLLSNAMKFSPENGLVGLDVRRRTLDGSSGSREFVRIEVTDRGAGIPAEDQETIFTPFGQSTLAGDGHYQSTGLGLAIVKQIVELIGGRVGVVSEAGNGAKFWVEVTLDHAPTEVLAGSSQRDLEVGRLPSAAPLPAATILVAEDNPVNQRIIRRVLERAGHEVTIVGDGEAAVDAASSGASRYDFMLMDIRMPKLDGLGATRAIRAAESQRRPLDARSRRLPIIALTANAMKGDDDLCMEAGFDGYLTKPLDEEDLFRTLAELDDRPPAVANEAA